MRQRVLWLLRTLGVFTLARWLTRDQQRILCYHGIWTGPLPHFGDCLFMSPARFSTRMAWLARSGWRVIPLDEALSRVAQGTVRTRDVVITIDDAWAGIVPHMLPVLRAHGFAATLYVTTYYVLAQRPVLNVLIGYLVERAVRPPRHTADQLAAQVDSLPSLTERWAAVQRLAGELGVDIARLHDSGAFMLMSPAQLRQAHAEGVDIQLHTHTHGLHDFSAAAVQREIDVNRTQLARLLNMAPASLRHFCYPSGDYEPRVFDALRSAGVVSATTTEFGLNPRHTEPLALKRILDCESMTELDLEARLSGLWGLLGKLRRSNHKTSLR